MSGAPRGAASRACSAQSARRRPRAWARARRQRSRMIVMSVSCPMADTIGIGDAATARATDSRLNAQRSSSDPPPRVSNTTSGSAPNSAGQSATRSSASSICASASLPCTETGNSVTRRAGQRRRNTDTTSRSAAPERELITARCVGKSGNGRLRVSANRPSSLSVRFNASNAARSAPSPESSR